ncbi:MAG: PucR family transcriptional regulator [Dorea sp.]|uniref:PucR family transcriptional regulator n=1 Tax=Sporofaciens musculi TaxID=2681861 RepID=UPI00216D4B01|nr:PucR family transcriptional regulator [Sporofaciens musculi]MCI9422274.1 PucR family transcriptional regulator [Dorea sp.]
MGLSVEEMLNIDIFSGAKLLGGAAGLSNEIKGATIIEAPDIVKFISGGEVLLTRFYAFQFCTAEEFDSYFQELAQKKVSAIVIKRGNDVEHIEEKVKYILDFAEKYAVPVLEVAFELSFREILRPILERLFNEEVRRLKYFKTTHDNFTALAFSRGSGEDSIQKILDVLEKLIDNPVALFNQNMDYLAGTEGCKTEMAISDGAKEYQPKFYSNYTYLKQKVTLTKEACDEYEQFIVKWRVMYNRRVYLVITASVSPFGDMDDIAIENGVTALKQEMFRQHSVEELEEKFQNDIITQILNGNIHTRKELEREVKQLGIPLDANYRVLLFKLWNEGAGTFEKLNEQFKFDSILRDAVVNEFEDVRVRNDVDQVIVIQQITQEQKQEDYRKELKNTVEKIQKRICQKNKNLKVRAGVGKEVEGVLKLSDSFKEARDSLEFINIFEKPNAEQSHHIVFFSDMGIFKLLCKADNPEELYEYIPESLQKLLHYKKQQRQELLLTLNTYLDRNQNLTKTAQELFIHYKTAAYRIDRIVKITGIDMNNASEVLAVRIGLIVYRMIENMKK